MAESWPNSLLSLWEMSVHWLHFLQTSSQLKTHNSQLTSTYHMMYTRQEELVFFVFPRDDPPFLGL